MSEKLSTSVDISSAKLNKEAFKNKNYAELNQTTDRLQNFFEGEVARVIEIRKIEQEKLIKNIRTTVVNEKNKEAINSFLDEIFKDNKEGIRQNFDLNIGDKIAWNKENKQLVISTDEGKFVFSIRFTKETKKERLSNEKNARESIEKGGQALGDWIVKRGAYPGRKNSCGESCGNLLNQFGFRKILPQSNRHGKNWNEIIESHASEYFDKIPVKHPNDAPAGSILVFDENAKLGSSARRKYGHVEIKGSDGMFYSYYKSVNAGGSSRTNEKNPEKYKKLTGFTGYAYVYNGKKPPR